jgi:hypothetical protein
MHSGLQADIDAAMKVFAARALLILIEWAGNVELLAKMAGYTRSNGAKWTQRGFIPASAALRIAKLPGCPLTAREITARPFVRCAQCGSLLGTSRIRTRCLSKQKAINNAPPIATDYQDSEEIGVPGSDLC